MALVPIKCALSALELFQSFTLDGGQILPFLVRQLLSIATKIPLDQIVAQGILCCYLKFRRKVRPFLLIIRLCHLKIKPIKQLSWWIVLGAILEKDVFGASNMLWFINLGNREAHVLHQEAPVPQILDPSCSKDFS